MPVSSTQTLKNMLPPHWQKPLPSKRPFVTLKVAITLDGKLAAANHHSQWITSPPAREHAHQLRAEHQAILVGHKTVLHDDPLLTVRLKPPPRSQPIRIILDSKAQLAQQSPRCLANPIPSESPIMAVGNHAPQKNIRSLLQKGIRVWQDTQHIQPSIPHLLKWLKQLSINSLLVEGGSQTYTSLIQTQTADALALYLAPRLMGQSQALNWCQDLGLIGLTDLPQLKILTSQPLGKDLFLLARFL